MGSIFGGRPKAPPPPPPPPPEQTPDIPTEVDEEVIEARQRERARARRASVRTRTILTSPQGLESEQSQGKTILGR